MEKYRLEGADVESTCRSGIGSGENKSNRSGLVDVTVGSEMRSGTNDRVDVAKPNAHQRQQSNGNGDA